MTHEEVRRLVPGYAAGDLDEAAASAVRAHLATGCTDCLADVFRHPVGLPRRPSETVDRDLPSPTVLPAPTVFPAPTVLAAPAGRRSSWTLGAMLLSVALVGAAVAWTYARVRRLEGSNRMDTARLEELERARAALAARVERLDQDVARATAEAARQAAVAEAATDSNDGLRRALEAAEQQITALRSAAWPESQADRLLASVDAQRVLDELTLLPGVTLLPLAAVAPYVDARGHVLWHPARPELLVWAFRLPGLPRGALYHVRLLLDSGRVEEAAGFRPGPAGDVILPVRLPGQDGLRAVTIVRDPDAAAVLTGDVGAPLR